MPAGLGDGRRLPHARGGYRAAGPGRCGPRARWRPAGQAPAGRPRTAQRLRSAWYELSLAGAAIAAAGVSWLLQRAIHAAGGYTLHQVPFSLVTPAKLGVHAATTGDSLLALFGANFGGLHSAAAVAFAVLHLACLALVAWALGRTLRRFASCGLVDQVLAVAIVVNLATYLFSSFSSGVLNGREIALVLPFGAALAARSLAPGLLAALQRGRPGPRGCPGGCPRWFPQCCWPSLAGTMLAGNGACLGYELAQPVSPPANARLASWLQAHHLTDGLSGYWQASVVTVGTGGRVTIRAVSTADGGLVPYQWEAKAPGTTRAPSTPISSCCRTRPVSSTTGSRPAETLATFGPPEQTFHTGPYTVLVCQRNLMNACTRGPYGRGGRDRGDLVAVRPGHANRARGPPGAGWSVLRGHLIRNDPCLSRQGDISVFEVPHFRCLTC